MTTILTGVTPGDGHLTEHGAQEFNERIYELMTALLPDRSYTVVPGGSASDEWNLLVRGNAYNAHLDCRERSAYAGFMEYLWSTEDPSWWDFQVNP